MSKYSIKDRYYSKLLNKYANLFLTIPLYIFVILHSLINTKVHNHNLRKIVIRPLMLHHEEHKPRLPLQNAEKGSLASNNDSNILELSTIGDHVVVIEYLRKFDKICITMSYC